MSDGLIEKMCEAHWNCFEQGGGDYAWKKLKESTRIDCLAEMRSALAILAKPENITFEMVDALTGTLNWMRCAEYGDMRSVPEAIAASIQSLLNTD